MSWLAIVAICVLWLVVGMGVGAVAARAGEAYERRSGRRAEAAGEERRRRLQAERQDWDWPDRDW